MTHLMPDAKKLATINEKWKEVLDLQVEGELQPIANQHVRTTTACMLENAEREQGRHSFATINEAAPATSTANVSKFDPLMAGIVRRGIPKLIGFEIAGVQPLTYSSGTIFAMTAHYGNKDGAEALFGKPDTKHSGTGTSSYTTDRLFGDDTALGDTVGAVKTNTAKAATSLVVDGLTNGQVIDKGTTFKIAGDATVYTVTTSQTVASAEATLPITPALAKAATADAVVTLTKYAVVEGEVGTGYATVDAEELGQSSSNPIGEMAPKFESIGIEAKSRMLKAEYTVEMSQDMNALFGISIEDEMVNILSSEIISEINIELLTTINAKAVLGGQNGLTKKGFLSLKDDAGSSASAIDIAGRFKTLFFQIQREANAVGTATRRGRANIAIVSPDVASILASTGMLNNLPVLKSEPTLNTDSTSTTFAGTLTTGMKVFVDVFAEHDYVTVGYKGASPYDNGFFYAPYTPLQMYKVDVTEGSFQPKLAFRTRYAMAANPLLANAGTGGDNRSNYYYRIIGVTDLLGK